VLVDVRAASVRVGAYFAVLGSPLLVRLSSGLRRPRVAVPGFDLAGVVAEMGAGVTRLRVGDEVFGEGMGTLAEFAVAPEKTLVLKPSSIGFHEAAAITTSGLAALHGLRAGRVAAGQRLLINGASGGVGTFAVQIAKSIGAEVTAVCSTRNLELVRSLGADHVVDYTASDFTDGDARYDVILDNVENHSLSSVRRVLEPRGTLVLNSGTGASGLRMLIRLVKPVVLSPFASHRLVRYLSNPNQDDLQQLADLVEREQVKPVVGRTYPLSDAVSAFELIGSGRAQGNVVVSLAAAA
jgi:NADPH:quinone reductase-like Zn-dependent oxidoreductase